VAWRRADPAEELAEECEAYLRGEYVEWCTAHEQPVPTWAWLNLLAQGSEEQLRAETVHHVVGEEHGARAYVAGEIVDLIDAGVIDLTDLQRHELVPLELDLIACPGARWWHPTDLLSAVLDALPRHRRHS